MGTILINYRISIVLKLVPFCTRKCLNVVIFWVFTIITGSCGELWANLRELAYWPDETGCCCWAARHSNHPKTLYTIQPWGIQFWNCPPSSLLSSLSETIDRTRAHNHTDTRSCSLRPPHDYLARQFPYFTWPKFLILRENGPCRSPFCAGKGIESTRDICSKLFLWGQTPSQTRAGKPVLSQQIDKNWLQCGPLVRFRVLCKESWRYKRTDLASGL